MVLTGSPEWSSTSYWSTSQNPPLCTTNTGKAIFTESAHWDDSVSKLRCPSIGLSVCQCHFLHKHKISFITIIFNVAVPISPLQKYSLGNKIRKDIGLRLCNFGSEMVKNPRAKKGLLFVKKIMYTFMENFC